MSVYHKTKPSRFPPPAMLPYQRCAGLHRTGAAVSLLGTWSCSQQPLLAAASKTRRGWERPRCYQDQLFFLSTVPGQEHYLCYRSFGTKEYNKLIKSPAFTWVFSQALLSPPRMPCFRLCVCLFVCYQKLLPWNVCEERRRAKEQLFWGSSVNHITENKRLDRKLALQSHLLKTSTVPSVNQNNKFSNFLVTPKDGVLQPDALRAGGTPSAAVRWSGTYEQIHFIIIQL